MRQKSFICRVVESAETAQIKQMQVHDPAASRPTNQGQTLDAAQTTTGGADRPSRSIVDATAGGGKQGG